MSTTSSVSQTTGASVDQWVFRIAGLFVLASLALSQLHSPNWLWFTAFVGANLLQYGFTKVCPLGWVLGHQWGLVATWAAYPATYLCAMLLQGLNFHGVWRRQAVQRLI